MVRNEGVDIDKIEFTLVHEKAKAFVEKSNDAKQRKCQRRGGIIRHLH